MVDVSNHIIINRPIEEVRAFASNPENAPIWYQNIKSAVWETEPPLQIGSQINFIAHFMGKKLVYTYEVIKMTDAAFVMKTAEGPFPMKTTYEWEAVDDKSTRMVLNNTGNPSGFSKLMAPLMSIMMKKATMKDLVNLKRILKA